MSRESRAHTVGANAGCRLVPPLAIPSPIAGHGANNIAYDLADPLEINAVLFTSTERRCLVVSFDLLFIGGELERQIRCSLSNHHGLSDPDVFLFASHTHFAPPTDSSLPALGPFTDEYAQRILVTVLELVEELVAEAPRACRLEVRRGRLSHSINRRRPRYFPSYTRSTGLSFARVTFSPNPRGPRDDTATVVSLVDAATKKGIAIIWHYTCHPVGRTPSNVISADFPGAGREAIRRKSDGALPVLFLQGFCGDIRPNIEPKRAKSLRTLVRDVARRVIAGILPMEVSERAWNAWVTSLAEHIGEITASSPHFVDDPSEFSSACVSIPIGEFFRGMVRQDAMRVCALRLGRWLEIIALGAEPCVGWQGYVTAAIGEPRGVRLCAGYCGDVFGYLPLPEQVDEGGYEVANFQPLFGMAGQFQKMLLGPSVSTAVKFVSHAVRRQQEGATD